MRPTPPAVPSSRLAEVVREGGFAALLLIGLGIYRRLWLGEIFFFRDIYLYFLPQKELAVDLLRSGEMPWWNSLLHGGVPLLADISQHLFYPPNLLYLALPTATALSGLIALHVVGASLAAYALGRELGLRQSAAVVAAVVYAYGGPTLSNTNLIIRLFGAPWLVLLVLAVHRALGHEPRSAAARRAAVAAAICGVLLVLSGAPEMTVFALLTALAWIWARPGRWRRLPATLAWGALGAGIAGLAAFQLLPMVELVGGTERGEGVGYASFSAFSLHPKRLPELVVPGFTGRVDTLVGEDFWGADLVDGGFPYLLSVYLGMVAVGLALAGLFAPVGGGMPRRLRRLCAVMTGILLVLCLGRFLPGFEWVYEVPGIRLFRFPIKLMSFLALPFALLAGAGMDAILRLDGRASRRTAWAAWGVLGGASTAGYLACRGAGLGFGLQEFFFGRSSLRAAEGLADAFGHAAGVAFTAMLLVAVARRRSAPPLARIPASRLAAWLLVGLTATDLAVAGRPVQPTTPGERLLAEPAAAAATRAVAAGGRLYRAPRPETLEMAPPSTEIVWLYRWNQETLSFYLGAAYGIPVIFHDDFTGLAPRRVMRLKAGIEALPWERRLPLLSAAGVRAVITHEELEVDGLERVAGIGPPVASGQSTAHGGAPFHLYRNLGAAPPVRLVHLWARAASEDDAIRALTGRGFDPRRHAVLEIDGEGGPRPSSDPAACESTLEIDAESPNGRVLKVDSTCPALVVFTDGWDPGWRVTVDGAPVELLRADVAFSAVAIEPGAHRVVQRYASRAFGAGVLVSLATLLGVALWMRWRPRV